MRPTPNKNSLCTTVRFWDGLTAEIDLSAVAKAAIPVKGVSHHTPLRFLEIFANGAHSPFSLPYIEKRFLPSAPGLQVRFDDASAHPPFPWKDADPFHLAVSFTYNTNAFARILMLLAKRGVIQHQDIDDLLDRACLTLSRIYLAQNAALIKNINNNLNMFLISRVIEFLVGKDNYDSDCQEMESTEGALAIALSMAHENTELKTAEKMGLAVAKGVAFLEGRVRGRRIGRIAARDVRETSHQYFQSSLAIDHRKELIEMIDTAGVERDEFLLAVILDDAAESVDDLLWLGELINTNVFLKIHLLLNTAQISVNFSRTLFSSALSSQTLSKLAAKLGDQLLVTEIYCPFISFQEAYLPPAARSLIQASDAVFIKGANFFETCQLVEKHTFHAFVVYGPISRAYTGLPDFSGVFAHLPPGVTGFRHRRRREDIVTLRTIVEFSGRH